MFGCRASVQGDASASANGANAKLDADLDAQVRAEQNSDGSTLRIAQSNRPAPGTPGGKPLLGARRDLTLAVDQAESSCSCLKVALGDETTPAFRWQSGAPKLDPETQLVVGLSSEGGGCPAPKNTEGASYWGYRWSGNDVVVYVENAVKGRPVAVGAVIPKPVGEGQVFIAPRDAKVPYGRGSEGSKNCKLGNPGTPRTAPVTAEEAGENG